MIYLKCMFSFPAKLKNFICHLVAPRESNNHRSKILHHDFLLFLIILLLSTQIFVSALRSKFPSVLGVSIDISTNQLLLMTNQKRTESGLAPVHLDRELSQAALLKAKYMFTNNFWAHNGPDGTTPWVFIRKAGYDYVYAGENLARGFTASKDVVDAWMTSPTHRDNMLSQNYTDIGFAVMEGKLLGEDTVLVVEMFGNKTGVIPEKQLAKSAQPAINSQASSKLLSLQKQPLFDSRSLFQNTALMLVSLFILVLILDMVIVGRRKIVRLVGHNLDHIFFLSTILLILLMIGRGVII